MIVLRSFTKFYAIPGLRLGIAYSSSKNISAIGRQIPAWSVNHLAQTIGRRA
ncbi:aminotransferase class I/II-fold pyridoxal phosphate-dependent enzyme, partial [bacterium AH-315-E10]|nr:aminotransferase class I/II-fold pyridoxal phosphate-dependent enzyme [bacterium AH-315-E10]